ncbi:MAG: YkgJ family cysteine cluster protein [Candidatus Omnitrophica bacterium]|nr:YkgJ family cysteine cluster protein [Candidatus Omnitrophota bacterium]
MFPRSPFLHLKVKSNAVLKIYREVDRDIANFKSKTSLRCLPGCGHCCESPKIETTVLEFLPLVSKLHKANRISDLKKRIDVSGNSNICPLYLPAGIVSVRAAQHKGMCSEYGLRPLLCRLYGFSVVRTKDSKACLVTCSLIKDFYKARYQKALRFISNNSVFPVMNNYALKLSVIDFSLGIKQYPIKEALARAVEYIESTAGFNSMAKAGV